MTNEYGAPLDRNGYAPSILQDDDSYCLICYGNGYNDPLNRHEVFGGAYRSKSKRLGLWCRLCHSRHHQNGPESVHQNAEMALELKKLAQHLAMEKYGWSTEDFIREFGKNYLEE